MTEISRYLPDQTLGSYIKQLLQEASHRWFRPTEICEILSNHTNYYVHPESPVRPPAGSLYLFDRKVLRYFRKDGYNWRKKKDGKTVKEAHEKLKVGGVDVLHCYYAHGEENEKFQRRIYWMLDTQFEHIVLVHYREANEGPKIGSHLLTAADPGPQLGSPKTSSASWSEQSSSQFQASYACNPNTVYWNDHGLPSEFSDRDSGVLGAASVVHAIQGSVADDTVLPMNNAAGFDELWKDNVVSGMNDGSHIPATSSFWEDVHGSSKALSAVQDQKLQFNQLNRADFLSQKLIDARLEVDKVLQNVSSGKDGLFNDTQGVVQVLDSPNAAPESSALVAGLVVNEAGELKRLDSFGRWMDREIGGDCDESLMASDSTSYFSTLDTANDDREVSSLSRHMQFDIDYLGPSLSQEKHFSISDFAPNWAYPGVETNILVTGAFLGDSDGHKWCCMFDEIEVSCEVVSDYMIRCQVPFHAPGRVPFYVTCGNRLSCSKVFEFEYRKNPLKIAPPLANSDPEELSVQIRLAKMLFLGLDRKWLYCSAVECEKCNLKSKICTLLGGIGKGGAELEDELIEANRRNFKDTVIQNLLKDKLYEWLVCKAHEGNKGPHVLDDEGQGIIHLTASLGYIWAFGPIIAAGVAPNFRDKQGRTSLHWASYYEREEAVITLIKLGAAAGAVDDPRPEFPGGQTAADFASARGHRGIAAYLAEADLTSHPLSFSVNEGLGEATDATIGAETALQIVSKEVVPANGAMNEDLSMKRTLAAIRKSVQAAAMIQAAFRAHSFSHRQLSSCSSDVSEVGDLIALGSLNKAQSVGHFDDYLHSSAIKLQQKYRGWKGRKDFLKIRNRIIKLQAHVRGHQVRKQYKKVIWSVSVVEKAILRWRRKKPGLRGFCAGKTHQGAPCDFDKNDEYDFLRTARKLKFVGVERALARVQTMVRHPEARD